MFRQQGYLPRLLAFTIISTSLGLTVYIARASQPQPLEQAEIAGDCRLQADAAEPSSRYFYNAQYGWFDRTHFNAGNPAKVIAEVRAARRAGGATITVEQTIHDGAAGFAVTYAIASSVEAQNEMAVALGIYQDWSYRFEAWQGALPQRLAALLSSFALEDLPSHYLGFFAAAHGLKPREVFACYLPGTVATDDSPPRLVTTQLLLTTARDPRSSPQRLVNQEVRPMALTKEGWQNVSWPVEMRMEVIDSTSRLWAFVEEDGWYFDGDRQPSEQLSSEIGPYEAIVK